MKSKLKYLAAVLSAAIAISLWGYGGLPAAAEESNTVTLKKTIETTDPEVDVAGIYTEEYIEGDKTYHLKEIEKQIISSEPEMEEETIPIVTEPVYEETELENALPEETIVQNEITYYLISSEVITGTTEERTEYGKTTIAYQDVEYVDELPATGKMTVTDSVTGKEYVKSLPLSEYTVTAENWKDDFTFPVTIYSVDADYYMLGDLAIPKSADLSQYGSDFLSYLRLDSDYYKVNAITLQGEPFEQDGEWVQKATAYGSRRTVDVTAIYEGNVSIPPEKTWQYQCVYSNIDPNEESKMVYNIQVTATYLQVDNEPEEPTYSLWEKLLNWIKDHPIESIVCILLFILVIVLLLFWVVGKKRRELKDGKYITQKERSRECHK